MKFGDNEQMSDQAPLYHMPEQGRSYDEVIAEVRELKKGMTPGQRGKLASTTFQGQEEMQTPQSVPVSHHTLKHTSGLIFHFSTPLTTTLSPWGMAPLGQLSAQILQSSQNSSTPISTGGS